MSEITLSFEAVKRIEYGQGSPDVELVAFEQTHPEIRGVGVFYGTMTLHIGAAGPVGYEGSTSVPDTFPLGRKFIVTIKPVDEVAE